MTEIALMECEYFPCIDWYKTYLKNDNVIIEQNEFFKKTTYRNRCYITAANSLVCLSVPVQGGRNQRTIMKDVKICNDEKWQHLHWKSLEAAYRRSPYFEFFEDEIQDFFSTSFNNLLELNLASLKLINNLLKIKKEIVLSKSYEKNFNDNIIDFRSTFLPSERKNNLYKIEYIQPFSPRNGFEPNLSMLDYIFCVGKADDLLNF
ncbi:MAG: WbqC family protein [Chitinophagaceae bacterium]|nr:WbqC family protein [Chitinophagaceae bacterium]